jgi:CheY-like chemotaxis protein
MMGGSISVESEYGRGSVFTVRLLQKTVTDAVIGEVAGNLKNFRYSDHKRRQNSQLPRLSLPYARVLVVDDVETNLDVAKGMMKPYGLKIDCVTSGREAIDALRDETIRYNAVFMDHMMPVMDGLEAVRIIREEIGTEYARNVPIIALTANAIIGNEEMFLDRGFQAFLPKPIEVARLDAVIRQWVRDKKIEGGREAPDPARTEEEAAAAPRFPGLAKEGLDLTKGLERFGHALESFLAVLRSYAVNTRPLLEAARKVSRENLADYAVIVHGIKGSSLGIGADLAGGRAEALEKAAKDGDFGFVEANNAAFLETVEDLIGYLENLVRQMDLENHKPKTDRPDSRVLGRLLAACEAYDMDAADAALGEIETYEYEADDGLAAWLRENVEQMNFTPIKEKLSALGITAEAGAG